MRRRGNFTLIELLIVIAIIAILASMLLPALNKARERGYAINCVANQKTLAQVWVLYADDYNGFFPTTSNNYSWNNKLYNLGYLTNYANYVCPVDRVKRNIGRPLSYGISYDNNALPGASEDDPLVKKYYPTGKRVESFRRPSRAVITVEMHTAGKNMWAGAWNYPQWLQPIKDGAASYPHNDRTSSFFADAHAELLGYPEILDYDYNYELAVKSN